MTFTFRNRIAAVLSVVALGPALAVSAADGEPSLRSQAVLDFTFEEDTGPALDHAAAGQQKDAGTLAGGAHRVGSPFWNQTGGRAVVFDAARKQSLEIPDSPDLDRAEAVSFGLFFLNLHRAGDNAYRGIIAKRVNDKQGRTNYGINFNPRSDAFQLYVNDGNGYRAAQYSVREIIGSRRRCYLTAVIEVGDAPGPDADSDRDDLRLRLFLNGQLLKPRNIANGSLIENDAWALDVQLDGLLNDTPLTLGCSNAALEHASCVIDEVTLFDRALTPEDAARLFREVAGPNAEALAKQEAMPGGELPAVPQLATLSLRGLQRGTGNRLVIGGQNLAGNPRVIIGDEVVPQTVAAGSNAGRLAMELTPRSDMPPGLYPLRVQTDGGLSSPLVIAVDQLPQLPIAGSSPENLATLPAAFSGELSGAAQLRVYFAAKQGQRIVADLEYKRLGNTADAVVEFKTSRGTPLDINWGRVELRYDPRCMVEIPADGVYFVEVHDLAYKAPGRSPFRLKVGALTLIDAFFPPAVARESTAELVPIGSGVDSEQRIAITASDSAAPSAIRPVIPADVLALGPVPAVRVSAATEVLEAPQPDGQLQTIDATFAGPKHVPTVINGRIADAGQTDRYRLRVTPGQTLELAVEGRSLHSPLDAELAVLRGEQVLMLNEGANNSRDPALNFKVPGGVDEVVVRVRDLYGRGGAEYLYRLRVVPSGRPFFTLTAGTAELAIPHNGSTALQMQVTRRGYNGPIRLSVAGGKGLTVVPAEIPAGRSGKMFLTLSRSGDSGDAAIHGVRIVGETVGLQPPVHRVLTFTPAQSQPALAGFDDLLSLAVTRAGGVTIAVAEPPPALFKGVRALIPLQLGRQDADAAAVIRLSAESTEAPRLVDPKNANRGNKPLIRAVEGQTVAGAGDNPVLQLDVPLDVAEAEIEFVARAELVPHAYSEQVMGTAVSRPFRVAVRDAVTVTLDEQSFQLKPGEGNAIRGTLQRTEGFQQPVEIRVTGLPDGYAAQTVTVAANETEFAVPVTAASEEKPRALEKIQLRVAVPGGGPVLPERALALKVSPAK